MSGDVSAEQGGGQPIRVDPMRYAARLEAQRNDALNDAAQWRAAAEQLLDENGELREENERLREQPPAQPPT